MAKVCEPRERSALVHFHAARRAKSRSADRVRLVAAGTEPAALTDDGATLCLAARASDYAALVRTYDLTLIATIPVGDWAGWAEVADGGKIGLIANTRSNDSQPHRNRPSEDG